MARAKRTKKRYQELFDSPKTLFPPTAGNNGVNVILFPNGQNAIWLQTDDGLGIEITAGNGHAGLGIHIRTFTCAPPLTSTGDIQGEGQRIELCQYRQDKRSLAYKKAYRENSESNQTLAQFQKDVDEGKL